MLRGTNSRNYGNVTLSAVLQLLMSSFQSAVSKRARTEVESRLLQTPKDNDGEDEFTTFGKTVANTIRKLPRVSQIFVRKKINDILFEAEIQAMRSASEDEPISMTDFFDRIS